MYHIILSIYYINYIIITMTTQIITPDYVIELNQDYTISNHGIHKRVCSYYRKNLLNPLIKSQSGGFIRGGTIFPKNCRPDLR